MSHKFSAIRRLAINNLTFSTVPKVEYVLGRQEEQDNGVENGPMTSMARFSQSQEQRASKAELLRFVEPLTDQEKKQMAGFIRNGLKSSGVVK